MASLLISIIFLSFVSLGLPDSLLGSAWPVMHIAIDADISFLGTISASISVCTIFSSLMSEKVTSRFGAGKVTAVSTFMTAMAIFGFSAANSIWMILLLCIPYGLGAGAIDVALNNYVALNLESKHMNWLHCCWGLGAMISPYIMGLSLKSRFGWKGGYRTVGAVQLIISLILFLSLPMWNKEKGADAEEERKEKVRIADAVRLPGASFLFAAFFVYCALEVLGMSWSSTYFNAVRGIDGDTAAFLATLFYSGMTVSRGVCGFISDRYNDRQLIRIGACIATVSALLFFIPVKGNAAAVAGFLMVGIGCGPIYPAFVHATPEIFPKKYSGTIVGLELAFAYTGTTLAPVLMGKVAQSSAIGMLPLMMLVCSVSVLIFTELLNRVTGNGSQKIEQSVQDRI